MPTRQAPQAPTRKATAEVRARDAGLDPFTVDRRGESPEAQAMAGARVDPQATALLQRSVGTSFGGPEINHFVHQGHYPQRPQEILQGQLDRVQVGWTSMEELMAALPEGEQLYKGEDGLPVRLVPKHTGDSEYVDGALYHHVVDEVRHVALTVEAARGATAAGIKTDFFNGWTWMRGGLKAEKDFPAMYSQQQTAGRVRLERASMHDVAIEHPKASRLSAAGIVGDIVPDDDRVRQERGPAEITREAEMASDKGEE